jgi:hypothetical protein
MSKIPCAISVLVLLLCFSCSIFLKALLFKIAFCLLSSFLINSSASLLFLSISVSHILDNSLESLSFILIIASCFSLSVFSLFLTLSVCLKASSHNIFFCLSSSCFIASALILSCSLNNLSSSSICSFNISSGDFLFHHELHLPVHHQPEKGVGVVLGVDVVLGVGVGGGGVGTTISSQAVLNNLLNVFIVLSAVLLVFAKSNLKSNGIDSVNLKLSNLQILAHHILVQKVLFKRVVALLIVHSNNHKKAFSHSCAKNGIFQNDIHMFFTNVSKLVVANLTKFAIVSDIAANQVQNVFANNSTPSLAFLIKVHKKPNSLQNNLQASSTNGKRILLTSVIKLFHQVFS